MPSRLIVAYGLIAAFVIAALIVAMLVLRRRRRDYDLRWGNKKRWKRRS
ncbi:MAG TPA: hypothetical protein VMG08_15680 [Allosphingosinicella sp.]|nr:hypothetical protein [Allosphingosinicella sp.]